MRLRFPHPFWLSLATLVAIAAVLAFAVVVPMRRQRLATEDIDSVGGTVQTRHGGPNWLRHWLGDERMEAFDEIYEVDFSKSGIGDSQWMYVSGRLQALSSLKRLNFSGTQLTDAGLAGLNRFSHLESLALDRTSVTDVGLEHLRRLESLEELQLNGSQVTDAGLTVLEGLPHLLAGSGEHQADRRRPDTCEGSPLSLYCRSIKQQSRVPVLKRLKGLSSLQHLRLNGTHLADADLTHLSRLRR